VRRHLARLTQIISWLLHAIIGVLLLCTAAAWAVPQFYFSKVHLLWIWLPLTDWRFRIMLEGHTLEIRTCFGAAHDYDHPESGDSA
jgi:hypothetical protein